MLRSASRPKDIPGLVFEKEILSEEVFAVWRRNEALDPGWQQCARDHGYASWEKWRRHRFTVFGGGEKQWFRFRILEPLITVPGFFGGPSKTWIARHYGKEALVRFADFVKPEEFAENGKVSDMVEHFPAETELTAIITPKGDVVVIEGTHRCVALTIAAMTQRPIETTLFLSAATWEKPDFPIPDPAPEGPKRVALDR